MEAESVGAVVGKNLERLRRRAQMTQHEAARLFARRGAPLSRSKIAAIEAGERTHLTFADVLVIAHTYNVEVAELFDGHGPVAIAEHVVLSRPVIRGLLRGTNVPEGSVSWDPQTHQAELLRIADVRAEGDAVTVGKFRLADADHALAQRLNVAPQIVVDIALQIWGNTLTEERDARVSRFGALDRGERHAHRGHITRELSQEIEAELAKQGQITQHEEEIDEQE
ncbi:helix-turn-helix transcriptional regulator [Lentzea sp. NPDC051213]|uniref:helix-turn-helix transcriptional regulator n=1 Tax=Lentzea sp. NPDC051213 TaxID=3364126 RepID=UPI0037B08737